MIPSRSRARICRHLPGTMTGSLAGLSICSSQLGAQLPVAARIKGVLLLIKGHHLGGHTLLKYARAGINLTNSLQDTSHNLSSQQEVLLHACETHPPTAICVLAFAQLSGFLQGYSRQNDTHALASQEAWKQDRGYLGQIGRREVARGYDRPVQRRASVPALAGSSLHGRRGEWRRLQMGKPPTVQSTRLQSGRLDWCIGDDVEAEPFGGEVSCLLSNCRYSMHSWKTVQGS